MNKSKPCYLKRKQNCKKSKKCTFSKKNSKCRTKKQFKKRSSKRRHVSKRTFKMNKESEVVGIKGLNNQFEYPTINQIIHKYMQGFEVHGQPEIGSSNFVQRYINKENGKMLSVRRTTDPVSFHSYEISDYKYSKLLFDKFGVDNEIEQSQENWLESSRLGLAPKIHFYGYVRKEYVDSPLYLLVISDGYQMSLKNFYKIIFPSVIEKHDKKYEEHLTQTDLKIQKQLTYQLNTLSKEMQLICYDIKPLNTVINFSEKNGTFKNLTVKLIDWDGDWCRKYPERFSKNEGGRNRAKYAGLLSNIIMANHFYTNFNRNIFRDYFVANKEILTEEIRSILFKLFCTGWTWYQYAKDKTVYPIIPKWFNDFGKDYTTPYHLMGSNYLTTQNKNGIHVPSDKTFMKHCKSLFEEMIKRAFVLNDKERITLKDDDFTISSKVTGIIPLPKLSEVYTQKTDSKTIDSKPNKRKPFEREKMEQDKRKQKEAIERKKSIEKSHKELEKLKKREEISKRMKQLERNRKSNRKI